MIPQSDSSILLDECQPEPNRTFQSGHFADFDELDTLTLKNQETTSISPNAFDHVSQIKYFHINLIGLPSTVFQSLRVLKRLELCAAVGGLDGQQFRNQRKLQQLSLRQNNGQNVTKEFFIHLPSIVELELIENRIIALASNVFDLLPDIETLNLTGNGFTVLPPKLLHSNRNLNYLYVHENNLEIVPNDLLLNSARLIEFTLATSLVDSIPSDFFEHSSLLTRIDMSDNKIKALPGGVFRKLSRLENLNLATNKLTSLPQSVFGGLHSIRVLDLSNNQLRSCPEIPLNYRILSRLRLSNNKIDRATSYDSLRAVLNDFSKNLLNMIDFANISSSLSMMKANKTVYREVLLHDNPIQCDEEAIDFVNYMENPDQSFEIVAYGGRCSAPPHLAGKRLSEISIDDVARQLRHFNTSICSVGCECHYRLSDHLFVMNCTKWGLANLTAFSDPQVPHYKYIELNFENQNVSELTILNTMVGSENVRVINARNNCLSRIPFENLPTYIQSLDFSNNKLAAIDETTVRAMFASTFLKTLWLSGNPLQCNCSTQILPAEFPTTMKFDAPTWAVDRCTSRTVYVSMTES